MKLLSRLYGFLVFFAWVPLALGQYAPPKIVRIDIKHVGPASVSDELIRANIHVKVGDPYIPDAVDDDVHNLYATGLFYNIRVTQDTTDKGVVLTFIVQANPRITAINFQGNSKYSDSKLMKKISSKVGQPLDEQKLFTDSQAIEKMYQKAGYPSTTVKYVLNIDENAGRGTVTFDVRESPKVKIREVDFVGANAFPEKKLRKVIKTRRHHWYSSIFGGGVFKEDQFEDDKDALRTFYYDHGYIDFEIKDVQFLYPRTNSMVIRIYVYEGTQYKVGAVTFKGTSILPTNAVSPQYDPGPEPEQGTAREEWLAAQRLHSGFIMKVGSVFTPEGSSTNMQALQNFYGSLGYIDVAQGGHILVRRIPNTETGTMDLSYQIDEGKRSYIERIEIRGNTKTKDRVIRRELAVSPGEVFDMTKVDLSQQRLEGLDFFGKVNMRPESTDVPDRKNLIVGVDEKNTGNFTMGAGFSSVDALVGFAEISQGNFDLFHPPTFTGGGQKIRLRVQLGTQRQDYEVQFVEPWFLGRKLRLGVDLYHRELN
ncbi:MAG TPA: POTRA domain-containing protein, partial [Verrucomicrobiae bacterium]|nr:POTRA domain-containing protein [Verrucomicrobiae bacterium]